jgi:hypothetical protein
MSGMMDILPTYFTVSDPYSVVEKDATAPKGAVLWTAWGLNFFRFYRR